MKKKPFNDLYRFAANSALGLGARKIIDVGGGVPDPLRGFYPRLETVCLCSRDRAAGIEAVFPEAVIRELSPGRGLEGIKDEEIVESLLLCLDLPDEEESRRLMLRDIREAAGKAVGAIIGAKAGGAFSDTAGFERELEEAGLTASFLGRARAESSQKDRFVAIVEKDAAKAHAKAPDDFKVMAIMTAYNEEDVIEASIGKLIAQGVEVYLIDNWSTDATAERAERYLGHGLAGLEKFPPQGPPPYYEWGRLLGRVEELSSTLEADWFIHHDADEARLSPWPGVSLRDGLYRVDAMGYNAIDHAVLNFQPTGEGFPNGADFEAHLNYFEFGGFAGHFNQKKAWKDLGYKVDLRSTAGHEVKFPGRKVYPFHFLLKHYPARSAEHGERKVFHDRKARWDPAERAAGWHSHYDAIGKGHEFTRDPATLIEFDSCSFHEEFLLERLSGIGVKSALPARASDNNEDHRQEAGRTAAGGMFFNCSGALQSRIDEATRLAQEGRLEEAAAGFESVSRSAPDLVDIYPVLCDLYLAMGRADLPRSWIVAAAAVSPEAASTFVEVGVRLFLEGLVRPAIKTLSSVVEADPDNKAAWKDLAAIFHAVGRTDNSGRCMARAR